MTAEQALRTAVGQALHRRAGLLAEARTNVCRLVDLGELPLPLSAERFAHAVVLQDRAEPATAPGEPGTVLEAMAELLGPGGALDIGLQAIYVKPFHRDRSHRPDDKSGPLYQPEPAWGRAVAEEIAVQECGLTMLVRLWDGYSTGLFLDQRANRQWVRKAARGRQVLNLFAYTRSFAVAALAGEARGCTCVDISRKYLDWGDRNLALNSLPNAGQTERRFVIPVVDFLRAARTRRESYGLIILDPPSFSRDKKGRTHRIAEDLPALCAACWELLEPGGHLLVSTNHQPLVDLPEAFERRVMAGLRPAPLSRGSHTPDADLPDIGTASMRYAVLTRP